MADQEKAPVQITPQELLTKSNPGIYMQGRDLTNPRELYSFVSHKTKSTEDLRTAVKQELASKIQSGGVFPHLSKAISMKDLRGGAKTDFMRKDGMSLVSMHQRHKNIKDLRNRKDGEEDKENVKNPHNLPSIRGNLDVNKDDLVKPLHRDVTLPGLRKGHCVFRPKVFSDRKLSELGGKTDESKTHESNGIVKRKLDKWFSEMPEEVFDKAQRVLMEESIRDRLALYQSKRQAKNQIPHPKRVRANNSRRVPNTYIQLSVDSFENLFRENSNDKLNKYKLQQKSLHKLKMHELDEVERGEGRHIDTFDFIPRAMTVPAKHIPSTARLESRDRQQVLPAPALANEIGTRGDIQNEKSGLKTVNMNDVAFDAVRTQNEDSFHRGDPSETMYANSIHHSKLPNKNLSEEDTNDSKAQHSLEKYPTRMNALTLDVHRESSLKQTIPAVEMPRNERREKQNTIIIGSSIVEVDSENDISKSRHNGSNVENVKVSNDKDTNSLNVEKTENSKEDNMDKPMTLIPTAEETDMDDATSISTTTRKQRQRSVLKKFNKLEVFSESQKNQMTISDSYNAQFQQFNQQHQPVSGTTHAFSGYKLDLKSYPQKTSLRDDGDIVKSEVRVQEVVFRFEPGEVIISKKPNAQIYGHKSSERARTIYGKSLVKEERKDAKDEGSRDIKSVKSQKTLNFIYTTPQSLENGKTVEKIRTERLLPALYGSSGKISSLNQQDTDGNHKMEGIKENFDNKMEINHPQNIEDSFSTPSAELQKRPITQDIAKETDTLGPELSVSTPPCSDKGEQNELNANSSASNDTLENDIAQEGTLTRHGMDKQEQLEKEDSEYGETASNTDSMSIEIGKDSID